MSNIARDTPSKAPGLPDVRAGFRALELPFKDPVPAEDVAVVLVHGYMRAFPFLYWAGLLQLVRELRARGIAVHLSRQHPTAGVRARGERLRRFLETLSYPRLVVIGHSMGGLDARWVASRFDPQHRISHVVTIGTPHRGSALAALTLRSRSPLARLARLLDRGALADLTPEGAAELNELMPDREDVEYISIAGIVGSGHFSGIMRRLARWLERKEGPNDGLVSAASASWGEHATVVAGDHLELIGLLFPTADPANPQKGRPEHLPKGAARPLRAALSRAVPDRASPRVPRR